MRNNGNFEATDNLASERFQLISTTAYKTCDANKKHCRLKMWNRTRNLQLIFQQSTLSISSIILFAISTYKKCFITKQRDYDQFHVSPDSQNKMKNSPNIKPNTKGIITIRSTLSLPCVAVDRRNQSSQLGINSLKRNEATVQQYPMLYRVFQASFYNYPNING